jgi:hypothetical protein
MDGSVNIRSVATSSISGHCSRARGVKVDDPNAEEVHISACCQFHRLFDDHGDRI